MSAVQTTKNNQKSSKDTRKKTKILEKKTKMSKRMTLAKIKKGLNKYKFHISTAAILVLARLLCNNGGNTEDGGGSNSNIGAHPHVYHINDPVEIRLKPKKIVPSFSRSTPLVKEWNAGRIRYIDAANKTYNIQLTTTAEIVNKVEQDDIRPKSKNGESIHE